MRALAEKNTANWKDEDLVKSHLFRDMKKVLKWLRDPQVDSDTKRLMKSNLEVRFYDSLLTMYAIKTADSIFIKQYHIGKLPILSDKKVGDPEDWCHGGYVSVLVIKSTSDFGRLMSDHLANMWETAIDNTIDKVLLKVRDLEANPKSFHMEQFINSTKKKMH